MTQPTAHEDYQAQLDQLARKREELLARMDASDEGEKIAGLYFRAPDGRLLYWRTIPILWRRREGFPPRVTVPIMRHEPCVGLPSDDPVPVGRLHFEPLRDAELTECGFPDCATYRAYAADIRCDANGNAQRPIALTRLFASAEPTGAVHEP